MADTFLPPAVLDMIVNAAEWTDGLTEALEPLEAINDAMTETTAAAGDMASAVGASADAMAAAVAAGDDAITAATEAMASSVTASMGAVEAAIADAAGASALSSEPLAAFSEGLMAAAGSAGDLAAAQEALKATTAETRDAVASLAEIQGAAGKDSDEYAAQLDAVAGAMLRQADAAYELRNAQVAAAGAADAAGGASDAAAGQVAALGDAEVIAGKKAVVAGDEEEAAGGKAAKGLKLWALAAVAGVAISVKMAGDFQQSMTRLVTSAGEAKGNLAMVSQGILGMSVATNTSTSQLATGMYQVESAGFHGAAGLKVLQAAAEGAQAEGADLGTVANAVTSGLNAYGLSASHATSFTNQMVKVVGEGKMTMQDLAGSLSAVLPIAATYKISFAQVGGALATMTSMGMSAKQGTQDLAHTIGNLGNPLGTAVTEMGQFGVSSVKIQQMLKNSSIGLTGTIGYLAETVKNKMGPSGLVAFNAFNQSASAASDASVMLKKLPPSIQSISASYLQGKTSYQTWYTATKGLGLTAKTLADQFAATAGKAHGFNSMLKAGNPDVQTFAGAMSKMLGGTTGLNTALMLTGNHARTFNDNVKGAADAAKGAGSNINNWGLIQKNFNFQLGSAEKAVQAMAISFGTALLPAATKAMKILAEFGGWLTKHTAACKALAIVVGVLLAGALEHGLAKALGTCVSGFKDVLANGGKVLGFFRSGEGEASGFSKVLSGIGTAGKTAWGGLKTAGSAISGAFSAAGSGIGNAITAVKGWSIWSNIAAGATKVWAGIQAAFNVVMDANPIILVALAIAALIAGIILAYIHFKAFRDIVNDVGRALKTGFLDALHAVSRVVGEVVGFVTSHWKLLLEILTGTELISLITQHWGQIKHAVLSVVDDVISFVKSHWKLLVEIIGGPIAAIILLITSHWNTIKHVFDEAWGYIKRLVRNDVNEVKTILGWFGSLPGKMRGWWDEAVSAVESTVTRLLGDARRIPGRILSAVGNLGRLLWNAGKQVVEGLIGGVKSMFGSLGHLAGSVGSHLLGGVKDVLGILSPSREFARIGEQITAGLSLGINSTAQQAVEESRRLAQEVTAAAASGTVTAAEAADLRKSLATALATALKGGVQDALGSGTGAQIHAATIKLLKTVWDAAAAGQVSRPQASDLAAWVKADNARLQALAAQRNAIAREISAAQSLASSTASAAEGSYNLSSAAGTGTAPASVSSIISTLKGDVANIRKFAANVRKLARMGLNKAYLQQIISMGPDSGGALAQELANSGLGDIKQINAAEAQITQASNQLGDAAVSAMYAAGKQSGAGFLAGLKGQEKAIEAVMASIAATMVKRIRKDLGISSPSKVFFAHGQAIAQGLALGIASGVGQVARAVSGLSAAASLAGTRSTVPAGMLSAGRSQPIVLEQHSTFVGQLDGRTVFTSNKQQTYRYNVRNSGQVTGVVKPGA